ncbi:MAG: PIN domain-containing protein [Anaerolineae bacterium]
MTAEILVDTNVLVYAYDRSEPEKQNRALDVLDRLLVTGKGALSSQVLAEFFNTTTRKLAAPLTLEQAYSRLEYYVRFWPVFVVTPEIILEAVRGVRDYALNFWDAQIWAVARLHSLRVIFSEDFKPGITIEHVAFVNPFAVGFDPQLLQSLPSTYGEV